jgi:CRISPR-associated protein Cas1
MNEQEVLLPARMLNEYAYCPRLCYIEWVEGEFLESADTLEGKEAHKRVDRPRGDIDGLLEGEKATSVRLQSSQLKLVAVIDLVEVEDGAFIPVDYKKGEAPDIPEGAWEPDRVQLCAQGLLLNESGLRSEYGRIYYAASKKHVKIDFNQELKEKTLILASMAREMALSETLPPPLLNSKKCEGCSMAPLCLPDETNLLKGEQEEARRFYPARDDLMPVYVIGEGISLHKREGRLEARKDGSKILEIPMNDISQVCLFGSPYITVPTLHELMERGINVSYFSHGGWFLGYSSGTTNKNVQLRLAQFRTYEDSDKCLSIAKQMIIGKIRNQRTMLRRNGNVHDPMSLDRMASLEKQIIESTSSETLLGIEGSAAQIYFLEFPGMLNDHWAIDFSSRNRRPPTDPVNAVLSYLYGILVKDIFNILIGIGLDPFLGVYHRPKYGKPALALDLMEEFRPIVADSVTITLFNNGELARSDFVSAGGGTSIKPDARRTLVRGYERRINTEIIHPVFGYKASYRRIIEVQSRLLARCLTGELDQYPAFCTR